MGLFVSIFGIFWKALELSNKTLELFFGLGNTSISVTAEVAMAVMILALMSCAV